MLVSSWDFFENFDVRHTEGVLGFPLSEPFRVFAVKMLIELFERERLEVLSISQIDPLAAFVAEHVPLTHAIV